MSGDADSPAPTESARALAQVAAARFNRFQTTFAPLENKYISSVFALRSPGKFQEAAGQASAGVQGAFGTAQDNLTEQLTARGVDPSAGAYQAPSRALQRAHERGLAMGVAGSQIDQADRAYQGLQSVVAMGNNQSADAVEGMGDVAARANEQAARSAKDAFSRSTGVAEIAGVAAGSAAGYGLNRDAA